MNNNEYIVIKELTKQIIQQYIMNQYPWGIITRPLTPIALAILAIIYVIAITMLTLSFIQILVLVMYGLKSLRYTRSFRVKASVNYYEYNTGTSMLDKLPLVSILIPIKGESLLTIERNIRNIAKLMYPKELLEVIYISDDPEYYVSNITRAIDDISRKLGITVKVLHRNDNTGYKGGALNYGLKYAKGDLIAIFDVDTIIPDTYLLKAVSALMNGYDAVTAVWKGYYTVDNVISRLVKFMYDVYNEVFIRGRFLSKGFPAISGNNIVIWKHVLESINGFCRCTGEDLDLSIRLRAMGYRVGLIDSEVFCEVPYTYPSLKRQFSRWLFNGIWNMKYNLRLLLTSREITLWEKIDGVLWMLQFPGISFAALSILITIVLSLMGVVIPPIPILFLEIINTMVVLPLFVLLLMISKRVGYDVWSSITNMVRSALLMIVMSFPMLIYSLESLLTDEWDWTPTPKGPFINKNLSLMDLIHELSLIIALIAVMITLLLNNQVLLAFYIIGITMIFAYGLRLVIPRTR